MKMMAAEFAAARQRLGWTTEQVAAEYGLTLAVAEAWERGAVAIPRDVARDLRWRAALEERDAVLEASGLPKCPTAAALDEAADAADDDDDAFLEASERLLAHAEACPTCRARAEYVERHGPPMPEIPTPRGLRVFEAVAGLAERLPGPLRPPEGPRGEGRRGGLMMAALLSTLAIGSLGLASTIQLSARGWETGWWREPLTILAAVIPGYFVGFYLAGLAFDATRRVRHRVAGYVLRGALAAAAIYGTIGLVLPLLDEKIRYAELPIMIGVFAAIGTLIGGALWVWHRLTGKLPKAAT